MRWKTDVVRFLIQEKNREKNVFLVEIKACLWILLKIRKKQKSQKLETDKLCGKKTKSNFFSDMENLSPELLLPEFPSDLFWRLERFAWSGNIKTFQNICCFMRAYSGTNCGDKSNASANRWSWTNSYTNCSYWWANLWADIRTNSWANLWTNL